MLFLLEEQALQVVINYDYVGLLLVLARWNPSEGGDRGTLETIVASVNFGSWVKVAHTTQSILPIFSNIHKLRTPRSKRVDIGLFWTPLLLKNEESFGKKSRNEQKFQICEYGILTRSLASLRIRCLFSTCKWNPSKGVRHPSEGGVHFLTCKWNPSEGVWHLSEGGFYF